MPIVPNLLVPAIRENRRDYQHKKEADFKDTKQGGKEKKLARRQVSTMLLVVIVEELILNKYANFKHREIDFEM